MTFTLEGPARPVFAYILLALCGTVGTVGYSKINTAEHEASVSRSEADRSILQRNRYEDSMQRCQDKYDNLLAKMVKP